MIEFRIFGEGFYSFISEEPWFLIFIIWTDSPSIIQFVKIDTRQIRILNDPKNKTTLTKFPVGNWDYGFFSELLEVDWYI